MQGPATGGQRGGKKGNHKTSRGLLCEIKSDWRSTLKFSASVVQNMQINRCKIMCCMIFLSEVAASNCRNKNRIYWIFLNSLFSWTHQRAHVPHDSPGSLCSLYSGADPNLDTDLRKQRLQEDDALMEVCTFYSLPPDRAHTGLLALPAAYRNISLQN